MKEIFLDQGFIYAIFVSLRQHKKLNLLMSFQIQSSQNLSDCNWTRNQKHLVHQAAPEPTGNLYFIVTSPPPLPS